MNQRYISQFVINAFENDKYILYIRQTNLLQK